MRTRIVGREDVASIVAAVGLDALMDEMIERIEIATREFDGTRTFVRTRDGFHYEEPDVGLLEWMPVMHTAETTTIKVVGYHPSNPTRRNLPTILSTISAYDTETGHLSGLTDGTFLTALRTGAASAVASTVLARPGSSVVGLVGCGAQAVTQLHALSRRFPVERVLVNDADPANAASLPERAAPILPDGIVVEAVSVEEIMAVCDIVSTSTSIATDAAPLFENVTTKPWLHVNAVGADFPGKVELPAWFLRSSLVCPDHLPQAVKEGECQQLEAHEIGPSLYELVADPTRWEHARDTVTVFDSTGWALQDRVAVQMLLHHAGRLDVGLLLELEDISDDPLNPYDFETSSLRVTDRVAG
jgi:ornithine cyclodeaminase/alanine dehydrogenase-like protein (mu-crystallin family)